MANIIIIVDLPIASADDVDEMEMALLLRDVKAGNIIDYVDADQVNISVGGQSEPMPQGPAYPEPY